MTDVHGHLYAGFFRSVLVVCRSLFVRDVSVVPFTSGFKKYAGEVCEKPCSEEIVLFVFTLKVVDESRGTATFYQGTL